MKGKTPAVLLAGFAAFAVPVLWILAVPVGNTHPDSPVEAKGIESRLEDDKAAAGSLEFLPFAVLVGSLGFAGAMTASSVVMASRKRDQMERGE